MLIAARIVQGSRAALMNPATLSIIAATFPPAQRGMAIGIWAGVSALALAIGPLVGGLLTEHLDWSWIFFVNIPVGILAIVVEPPRDRESKDESEEQRLDFLGLLTSGIGLFALTYGLIEANTYGWTSALILGSFAVAAVAARRRSSCSSCTSGVPMLDLSLFKNGTFAGANIVDPARRARDVRRVLLRLALHAEHPRLLGRAGRGRVPADDDPGHPGRADRREGLRPHRLALAHDRRA